MKKGKSSRVKLYSNLKTKYGTVDSKDFKSIYLIMECWLEPKEYCDNWRGVTRLIEREIKHTLLSSIGLTNYFINRTIVDLDIRHSGIEFDKRSFMSLEITLFVNGNTVYGSPELNDSIIFIFNNIYNNHIISGTINRYFNVHRTKRKDKIKVET